MGQELLKIKQKKNALKKINDLYEKPEIVLLIHYSCESFYDRPNGRTPRITSIAVRKLSSGQTSSFSIHKVAEQKGVTFNEISLKYDDFEKVMLDEFFDFVNSHKDYIWVHWNMRDSNYGFAAIEHRYRVLNGDPIIIEESKKFDLVRHLVDIYGVKYIGHPRLEKLIEKNHISKLQFLSGEEEARAFDDMEYVKLHQSTLRKVDTLANILGRVINRTLKTNAHWRDTSYVNPKVLAEIIKEHWLYTIASFAAVIVTLMLFISRLF